MELKVIWKHARAAALECCDGSIYETENAYRIYLNGEFYRETKQVVNVLYQLEPEKEYCVSVEQSELEYSSVFFQTFEIYRSDSTWSERFSKYRRFKSRIL